MRRVTSAGEQRVQRDRDEEQGEIEVRGVEEPHRLDHAEVLGALRAAPTSGGPRPGTRRRGRPRRPGRPARCRPPATAAVRPRPSPSCRARPGGRPRGPAPRPAASARRRSRSPRGSGAPAPRCAAASRRRPRRTARPAPTTAAGHRGPADQGREAAGQPAPDDVLGGPPLEQHRVAEDVERVGGQRQRRRERVDPDASTTVESTPSTTPKTSAARGETRWRGSARRRVRRICSSMSRS